MKTAAVLAIAVCLAAPQAALAVITFDQLDDDLFVVSHRIKAIGSRGKAMKMVYEKAASLCVAAGYSHMQLLDQESNAGQQYEAANASVRVRFFFVDADERIECEEKASAVYVQQAREKLARTGYRPPDPAERAEAAVAAQAETASCTVEQITAMARAGLSDEQIAAACGGGSR